jgi:hypothetical protein
MKQLKTYENFCMEADHYTKCPRFKKDCDAINCAAKYTWQEVEAIKRVREKASK